MQNAVKFLYKFSLDEMIPAASQGILGIESLDEPKLLQTLAVLNDEQAVVASRIERDFIKELEGGCQVPIGVNAEILGTSVQIRAILGLPDGSEILQKSLNLPLNESQNAGILLAKEFIGKGAKELLKRAEMMI